MNLQQLEYFKAIAETENFTIAADLLSLTQPALSKAISKLEEELRVPLFEKKGRNIKLTRYGKMFLSHTKIALDEIDKGIKEIEELIDPDTGSISISSTSSIGTYFMPFIISDFLNNNPNTKFHFNQTSVSNIVSDIKLGKIDLGFYDCINVVSLSPEIESIPIKSEEYVLIVPKSHSLSNRTEVSLKELKDEFFIASCVESREKLISYSELLGYIPKISIRPSEASMLEGLVAAGAGISLVPNSPFINKDNISILKIEEKLKERVIYMGWHKDSFMSPIAKLFKDYVTSSIK